ncbi:hypothetical protein Glove_566g31 [Diversispora epigaea]|uniref:Uncharacterized protein n=1 Tax=Diversispora epigaea TaxID=1348612 RepID=A0A397GDX4_9GLOM|nr:hypothetical protein Glove_566g31 [Diversispora epigaea]
MYTQEPEYNKETITSGELFKLARRSRKPKIYNPKTNRMIVVDGPAYNNLIHDGYLHWKKEGLLIPPIHDKQTLGKFLSFISNRIWEIAHDPEKSLFMLINGKVSLLQLLLEVNNDYAIHQLLKIDWDSNKTQEWRSNVLMEFLHHPDILTSNYKPNALYDAFIKTNVLGPEHILSLQYFKSTDLTQGIGTYHVPAMDSKTFDRSRGLPQPIQLFAYKLSSQMSSSELSRYSDELTKDLSRGSRDQTRRRLRQIGYSEERVRALIPFQKSGRHTPKVNSIKDLAQSILKNSNISCMEINEDASHIAYLEDKETTIDIARSSQLSYLRRELHKNGTSDEVIDATKDRYITEESNRLQKMRRKILTHQKLDSPDHFTPEVILERLQGYRISDSPTEQALADIITMLCMRPAEVTTLRIANGHVMGYAKGRGIDKGEPRKFRSMEKDEKRACELFTWIQKAIANGVLRDPGIPGIKWFNSFLKPYGIKPSDLRELGANYTAMIHEPENPGQRLNIMREALRHNPRYVSPVKHYAHASHIAYLEDKETTIDIARSSQLSYLRRELHKNGTSDEVIDATKDRYITEESNRLQKMRRKILTHQKLDSPDHFTPEVILERLQGYRISDSPTEQALADIITMLCMRPAEVTTLRIANGHVMGYAKGRGIDKGEPRKFRSMEKDEKRACELFTWIQKAIANGVLRDPGIPGIKWFNSFLKPYGIKPSDLRELGANYTAMIHEPENPGQRLNIMREALRHNPRYVSPVKHYARVPYRAIGCEPVHKTPKGSPIVAIPSTSKSKVKNSGLDDIMNHSELDPDPDLDENEGEGVDGELFEIVLLTLHRHLVFT